MKFFKREKERFISQVVILAMIFGFAAGVVGQIFSDVYINPWQIDYGTNANLSANIPELKPVEKFLGIQQDFEVNSALEKITPTLAGIYQKKIQTGSLISQIYLPNELQANGFILTADGWLVSYNQNFASAKKDGLAVVVSGKVFSVQDLLVDAVTGVAFLKIAANNLPVVTFGDSEVTTLGQLAVALNSVGQAAVVNIENTSYQRADSAAGLVMSSERYSQLFLLADSVKGAYLGSPLINLGGEVIGIIKEINEQKKIVTAVPINQFRQITLSVLRSKEIKRPLLGLSYLDLATTANLDSTLTYGQARGAFVYQNPKAKTPAALAGLKANDIILSVDNQLVNKKSNLTELIQQYKPGDKVTLEILRAGKEIKQEVTLGSLAE